MRRGDKRTIHLPDGKTLEAAYLGAGNWCKAWKVGRQVYLFTAEDDFSKDILADSFHGSRPSRIPPCKNLGDLPDGRKVYRMPLYEGVTAKHGEAWAEYKRLREATEKANVKFAVHAKQEPYWFNGYNSICWIADRVGGSLGSAVQWLADASTNYGSSWWFEAAPRNLGVTRGGRLILRDCLFDREKLLKERANREQHWRPWALGGNR